MITTKNVQALKIGESLYAILFLTHKSSLSAYTERYSSLSLLYQKSQCVMDVDEVAADVKWNTLDLVSIRQRRCSIQRNGWFWLQNTIILLYSYYEDCILFERFKFRCLRVDGGVWVRWESLAGMSCNCHSGRTSCINGISLLTIIIARQEQVDIYVELS